VVTAAYVVIGVLVIVGLIGSVVPGLPGTPLIVVAALVHGFVTDWDTIGVGRLLILVALSAVAEVAGYLGTALGTRRSGGSGWAVIGAVAGAIVGLTFAPLGLIVGPLAGAVVAEAVRTGDVGASLRTGIGAGVGFLAGAVMHLAIAVTMVALFLWWLWRG
jgi:uncharacterized protein YqgC (DUF456 family)